MGKEYLEIKLPTGEIVFIDSEDSWTKEKFPYWRRRLIRNKISAVMVTRYLKTEFGSVRQDIYLHRLIMYKAPGRGNRSQIDHKDRNPLNNKKENLRFVTPQQNSRNWEKMGKNRTSHYRGVFRTKTNKTNPWIAQIKIEGKAKHLGCFKTQELAAKEYNKWSAKVYGSYGWINEIKVSTETLSADNQIQM